MQKGICLRNRDVAMFEMKSKQINIITIGEYRHQNNIK